MQDRSRQIEFPLRACPRSGCRLSHWFIQRPPSIQTTLPAVNQASIMAASLDARAARLTRQDEHSLFQRRPHAIVPAAKACRAFRLLADLHRFCCVHARCSCTHFSSFLFLRYIPSILTVVSVAWSNPTVSPNDSSIGPPHRPICP